MLNLNHLRLFHAVATEGGFTPASRRLRLSQPAISKQVRDLERDLGIVLLERLPRGVRPTAAGVQLAAYASRLFGLAGEAERAMAALRSLERGRLTLGASMTIGVYLMPALLAACRKQWPDLEIELHIENTATIQRALADYRWDAGLTEGPGPLEAELDHRVIHWDELILIAPGGARVPKTLTAAYLNRQPWVLREPGSGTRAVMTSALARHGIHPQPAFTFNNPEAIKRAVMAGCGIAIVPRITVASELAAGDLKALKLRGLELRRPFRLQWLRTRPPSPALAEFMKLAVSRGSLE